jgi:RimJ/RimL family protein N-acetyltransferase
MFDDYHIRQFGESDWEAFKSIRLEALLNERRFFGSNYEREAAFSDEKWQSSVQRTDIAFWGLCFGDELVGMTGILLSEEKPEEAILIASYIKMAHRWKGLSAMFYEVRINWAKINGCRCIIVSHRADNRASKAANQHFGFQFTHKENRLWPDGTKADNIFYKLEL